MKKTPWSENEIAILEQYSNTSKSAYQLYHLLLLKGYDRTYKAVTRKIESLGLRKPSRYATGHEKTIGYLDIETTGLKANVDIMLSWAICLYRFRVIIVTSPLLCAPLDLEEVRSPSVAL